MMTKPIILVGTDDMENIEVIRSGEMEVKKSKLYYLKSI